MTYTQMTEEDEVLHALGLHNWIEFQMEGYKYPIRRVCKGCNVVEVSLNTRWIEVNGHHTELALAVKKALS